MPRFVKNEVQLVQPNQPILLEGSLWANRRYLFHLENSGIITLRGIVNSPYVEYAVYQATFNGNIAYPTGATVSDPGIAVAIARNGEPILTSKAIVTPTAVDSYFNVTSTDYIIVPRGCCFDISVENVSDAPTGGTAPAINVQNANLTIIRVA